MSGSAPQQQGEALQQQLIRIGESLPEQNRACSRSSSGSDPLPVFQPPASVTGSPRAPGRRPPPCCSTAAPGTPASCWPCRDTCAASRTTTETRESPPPARPALVLQRVDWFNWSVSIRPLHLAIIHQQSSVTQQLIQTLLSSQQNAVLNTCNHLQQVSSSRTLTSAHLSPGSNSAHSADPPTPGRHHAAAEGDGDAAEGGGRPQLGGQRWPQPSSPGGAGWRHRLTPPPAGSPGRTPRPPSEHAGLPW